MNRKSGSGSNLFLMEMLVVVGFFILCASTCILIFVKSNNLSQLAEDTNRSVIEAQSIAEFFKADRVKDCMIEMKGIETSAGEFLIQWNKDWDPINDQEDNVLGADNAFHADVAISVGGRMQRAKIVVKRVSDGVILCELDVDRHIKERVVEGE